MTPADKLTNKELEAIKLSEEAYTIFYNKFTELSNERRNELLQVGLDILIDKLKINEGTAAIIQQLIHFRMILINLAGKSNSIKKLVNDEIEFIIKIVLKDAENNRISGNYDEYTNN